ncbi:MAG: plasmid maintenance system killer protein [Gammaproteobacteria bacterium RIFCSPHIGHO2_02_FULL_39_13]|nr:MAG: plasmid maintenance system killer protein [Gammaproteobacteria bacterium RIFCSPHIGHO2_02_FULL_39_13]OGT50608.1 MAG: plasmid maintenance system killer protein [Gammaproteobacteria bacterium RIFCSPHIGHO2_12_FULL_39_24]
MIKGFKNTDTEFLFNGKPVLKWQAIRRQAERRLQILDSATCINDLRNLPSNGFEVLKGDRKGQYSIRINIQWRICFKLNANDEPYDVEIVDYH